MGGGERTNDKLRVSYVINSIIELETKMLNLSMLEFS